MTEVRVNVAKAAANDPVEKERYESVQREIKAGNLAFWGYDKGVAVYRKILKETWR